MRITLTFVVAFLVDNLDLCGGFFGETEGPLSKQEK